jgi:glycosyltransferase involved in cell wall biosynthesis
VAVTFGDVTTAADGALAAKQVPAVAVLFVPPTNANHLMTAVSALKSEGVPVVTGGSSREATVAFREVGCDCLVAANPADLINQVWALHHLPVLVVGDAVSLPESFLGPALRLIDDDLRVGTVSFLCNDAAFLSFPFKNEPSKQPPEGHDPLSVTRRLRELTPHGPPVPIPTAAGSVVLLAPSALGSVGALVSATRTELGGTIADFAARARAKGFLHLLDDSTFYRRHRAAGDASHNIKMNDDLLPQERHWVHTTHPNEIEFIDHETDLPTSPLALSHGVARVKVMGLRVVVDGSYLGPHQTGTQVSILATVEALCRRRDVREVVVALGNDVPQYAAETLSLPKILARAVDFETLAGLDHCDVAHRLVQPDQWFSVERWRTVADRVVVTVLDLIAYRNGAYHQNAREWLTYRDAIRTGVADADAVVTISEDVKKQIEIERLAVDPQRLHAIPFGTEHLTGNEQTELPSELLARGFIEGQFILCLGNDYAHKNRDIAIEVVAELRRRGHAHALVMAGPSVPYGSSRLSEASLLLKSAAQIESEVYLLPDLPSAERNWLMRHADLVLYPSSSEGFGFVPYEAARFGTPSIFTRFGPLTELAPDIPVSALDWSPEALATAADVLLSDPAQARLQVESLLNAGSKYTWAGTAERLTELYRHVMAIAPK